MEKPGIDLLLLVFFISKQFISNEPFTWQIANQLSALTPFH